MSDNKDERGKPDRDRINVHEDYELRYWSKELGLTHDQLKEAVKKHGVMVKDVRKGLGK